MKSRASPLRLTLFSRKNSESNGFWAEVSTHLLPPAVVKRAPSNVLEDCPSGRFASWNEWKNGPPIKMYRVQKYLLLLMAGVPLACFSPQTNPVDTAPIPANARILDEPCSSTGIMVCGGVSVLSGDTSAERRSACIVYIEPGGRRTEQCGSLPASHP